MLVVLGDGVLPGQVNEQDLPFAQDGGKIQGVRALAQNRANDFVFHKWLNAVQRGFNSLLARINLHAFQPFPFSSNTGVGDSAAERVANWARTRIYEMLRLNERDIGGD